MDQSEGAIPREGALQPESVIERSVWKTLVVRLKRTGTVLAREPLTIQLRYLQTLTSIASEKNSTIIFPVPVDLIKAFMDRGTKSD